MKRILRSTVLLLMVLICVPMGAQVETLSEALVKKGLDAFAAQDYQEALDIFDQLIEEDPKIHMLHKTRGRILFFLRRHKEAISSFTLAMEIDSTEAEQYFFRSLTYSNIQEDQMALEDMRRALNRDGSNLEYLGYAASGNHRMGEFEKAIELLELILSQDPEEIDALFKIGHILSVMDEKEKSDGYLKKVHALIEGKYDLSSRLLLSSIYSLQHKYDVAIDITNELIADYPDLPVLYGFRAADYLSQKEFEKAIEDFRRQLKSDPTNGLALSSLAYSLLMSNRPNEAILILDPLIEELPNYFNARCHRALAYYELRNLDLAMNDVSAALKLKPLRPRAHKLYADILFKQNKMAEGCEAMQIAIDRYHDNLYYIEKTSAVSTFETFCRQN